MPSTPLWRVFTDAPEAYTVKGRTPDGEVTLSEGQAGEPVDIDATSEAMQEVNALSVVSGDGGALLPETSGTSATCWPVFDWANEYFMTDHLGTVRGVYEITQNYGEAITGPWVKAWKDYEPFGFELYSQVPQQTSGTRFEFTGHERDEREGGFDTDYMRFRFYGDSIGRFLRPDNISGTPYNPQSWNLYAYVRGNPVNFNDPTGHEAKREESKHQRVVEERPPNIGDALGGNGQVSTEGGGGGNEGSELPSQKKNLWDRLKDAGKKLINWFKRSPDKKLEAAPPTTGKGVSGAAKAAGSKANPAGGVAGTLGETTRTAAPATEAGTKEGINRLFLDRAMNDLDDPILKDRGKAMAEAGRSPGDALVKLHFLQEHPGFDHWPTNEEVLDK